jgi:hypothetical protein
MTEQNELVEGEKEIREKIEFYQKKADEIVDQRRIVSREHAKLELELRRMNTQLSMIEPAIKFNMQKLKALTKE